MIRRPVPLLLLCFCASLPAMAHVGAGPVTGVAAGLVHPVGGLDHLAAMVAVGLWAAQLGGRALWALPATFVAVMALGAWLGAAGPASPLVETGIAASVLILGVLVLLAVRLPTWGGLPLAGLFALLHGHAHGGEMPWDASGLAYGAGFVLSTMLLHGAGIALGLAGARHPGWRTARWAGAAIAGYGLFLLVP
jgi:urease accessory protein